jgi:vitamin B12 transporter
VVTASLAEEETSDLPASVTVLTEREIADRQATQVQEMLRTVPGVIGASQGSPGKLTSFFLRGTSSTQTLVLWNGIPLNDPSFGGFDWAFLSTDGVERIEVVRGPFSPLWGSEAIGGVVQVLTRAEGSGRTVRLEGGQDGYRRGGFSLGAGGDGPAHLDLAGHLRRGDGQLPNDFYDGEGVLGRLGGSPWTGLDLGVMGRWNHAEIGLPFDFLGNPSPEQTSRRESTEIALPVTWSRARWEVEAQLYRHTSNLLTQNPDVGARDEVDIERRGGRLVVTHRFGERLWVAGGGDWKREEGTTASSFGGGLDGDSQRTVSAFAQVHALAGPVRIDVGARRDDNDVFGGETSLKLGAVWALSDHTRLHASWGEGFRAPSLGELFFPGFGNPDLEAERSTGVEVGLDLDRGPWVLQLTAFDNDLENLISSAPPLFLPFNVGRASTRGLEAGAALNRKAVSARVWATYLDTEDLVTGEPLLRRPEWSGSLVVTWRPASDWTLDTVGRWVGSRTDFGGVGLASYTTLDVAAAWQASRHLEPYARVENLFDEAYEEAAGFPAPGRTWVGGLALTF